MARYLQTAAKAQNHIGFIMGAVNNLPTETRDQVLYHLISVMNIGFRCNPRAASGTIRLNSLQVAFKNFPEAKLSFVQMTGFNGKPFKALSVNVNSVSNTEADSDNE